MARAQLTIFIIIAILIVAVTVFVYWLWQRYVPALPKELKPIEAFFKECINLQVKEAVQLAGLQAGYLKLPEFEPGSAYMPFSNQLAWLGMQIPYWWYVSGNNVMKIQKPSLETIEAQLASYLEEKLQECNFESFKQQGYEINFSGRPEVKATIAENSIKTFVKWPLTIRFEGKATTISEHKTSTETNFGFLYGIASKIFDKQQQELFLENYALDSLRLYAPVTGIEIQCAPLVWQVKEVKTKLQEALEGNVGAIKVKGSYYQLREKEHSYFELQLDKPVDANVYFLYHRSMPFRFEVWPQENGLMKAEPIGKQPGLSMLAGLGFCYVPYHFVYDVAFPVLVQLSKGKELFQFPVVVLIENNQPRNATLIETETPLIEICNYPTQPVTIFSYDEEGKPIEAKISFKCLNQVCPLGSTELKNGKASLEVKIPQCINSFLIAEAPGYGEIKLQVSSIEPFTANLFLKPEHRLELKLNLEEKEKAIVSFISESYSVSVYWPEQRSVKLVEGLYNVTVLVFRESPIQLEAQQGEYCTKIPAPGMAGVFGITEERCFELQVPAQTLTNVLFGGGSKTFYVSEEELAKTSKISIEVAKFDVPKNLLELGDVYSSLKASELVIKLE